MYECFIYFRSHYAFIEDCLSAYICAAGLKHFGIETFQENPVQNKPGPLILECDKKTQYMWLVKQARMIRNKYLLSNNDADSTVTKITDEVQSLDTQEAAIQGMVDENGIYHCTFTNCHKTYKKVGFLRRHLVKVHNWKQNSDDQQSNTCNSSKSKKMESQGNVATVRSSFVKLALLIIDTWDAYRHCDGNRVFRNAKLAMLYSFSVGHTKYRQWLWRMVAYEMAILSPRRALEYKWNISVNLNGGAGENIADDNLVELQVKTIKNKVQTQGSNATFESAKLVCETTQVIDSMKSNIMKENGQCRSGQKRPDVDKSGDILILSQELIAAQHIGDTDKNLNTFGEYKDPLDRLDYEKLHKWMQEQKQIAVNLLQ